MRGMETTVVDECGSVWLREAGGDCREESLHLDLAVGTKAGGDAVELGVVVTGMADEFEDAFGWEAVEDLGESRGSEVPCSGDAYGALSCKDSTFGDLGMPLELWTKRVEKRNLRVALETGMSDAVSECWLEWVTDGRDGCVFEGAQQRARDAGEEVCVLVGVYVSDGDTGVLETQDLSESFADDLVFADLATEKGADEVEKRGAEGFSVGAE